MNEIIQESSVNSSRENYLSNYAGYNGHPDITNVNYPTNYNLGDDIFINATVMLTVYF